MKKHTKSPWSVHYRSIWSYDHKPDISYKIETEAISLEEIEANSRLIAAAPELYEALESVLALFENQDHEPDLKEVYAATVSKIESAMSKARGKCD